MAKCKLILVGGFLGAGKTSLLWRCAQKLGQEGKAVGLITNDQAGNLVDTAILSADKTPVREVSGSCFCCNFNGFAAAIEALRQELNGGIILAEPVGSCTDLSATIMQPLKDKYNETVELSPMTVLADPRRLEEILANANAFKSYIAGKQLEEADVILISKIDLLTAQELDTLKEKAGKRWPQAKILAASAKEDSGVTEWLEYIRSADLAGTHLAKVDYDVYAAGEAAYGWLNANFSVSGDGDFGAAAKALLGSLADAFDSLNARVGHVKFMLQSPKGQWLGNLTGKADTASLRTGAMTAETGSLLVNARVELRPEELQKNVLEAVNKSFSGFEVAQTSLSCLIPGRPNPTYRYDKVV